VTMAKVNAPPERTEAAPYYFRYIDRVGEGDIRDILEAQRSEMLTFLRTISEERSLARYAPGKWSIRQVLSHINDSERVFTFRAFWFARGFDSPLPSFDQEVGMRDAAADERSWASHIEELENVRASTLDLFRELPPEAWLRVGVASDNPFSVRALAYIVAGHATHHVGILKERYLS
jgi:uncharacterized damage-inducible protein DinB